MTIYVSHASSFDFQNELYVPLRNSELNTQHTIILPHEKSLEQFNSKDFLKTCDLVLAEVSHPSTGQGIELGWADMYGVPIVCVYKEGAKVSGALKVISKESKSYKNTEQLIQQIEKLFMQLFD